MVYIVLESGREYLLIGDTAWHMDGVRLVKGKDAPWVSEDTTAILSQLKWLEILLGLNGCSPSSPVTTTSSTVT